MPARSHSGCILLTWTRHPHSQNAQHTTATTGIQQMLPNMQWHPCLWSCPSTQLHSLQVHPLHSHTASRIYISIYIGMTACLAHCLSVPYTKLQLYSWGMHQYFCLYLHSTQSIHLHQHVEVCGPVLLGLSPCHAAVLSCLLVMIVSHGCSSLSAWSA